MTKTQESEFYEISAVSRLTGLSTHVLRVWEKRYGVVEPERTDTGRRRYNRNDVSKLNLLKSLVDCGHTISSIADLDIGGLENRLREIQDKPGEENEPQAGFPQRRVGYVGNQSSGAVHDASETSDDLSIAAEFPDIEFLVKNSKPGVIDILIVEVGSLFPEDLESIRKAVSDLAAKRAVVIYQFAASQALETVAPGKITLLRGPVNSSEVLLACRAGGRPEKMEKEGDKAKIEVDDLPIPPRHFTPEQLRVITRKAPTVKCECPQHLANLLTGLVAFEEYSGRCEIINEEDADLHRYLQQETANCRLRLERALQAVLESEGIRI